MAAMGITRIANITGLDRVGVPTVAVTRPNARSVCVSQGKGTTLEAAKASGLMESIETYHAEHITQPLVLASHADLFRSHPLVDVEGLPRSALGAFGPHHRLLWIEGGELFSGSPVFVPFEVVHTDFRIPLPAGSNAFLMSSNGLASGNHLLEAMSHGICELVERDSNTLFNLKREPDRAAARLDLGTVDDPACARVLTAFALAGIDVVVWETTSDVGIPAFSCHAADHSPDPASPMAVAYGSGCHPRREVALLRALTEAAQCRLTLISGARDDLSSSKYEATEVHPSLLRFRRRFDDVSETRAFGEAPSHVAPTFDADVEWELERLSAAGIGQVAVVDLTKREFDVPVVRVVIPGLESIGEAPGYVPGARAQRFGARSA